MRGLCRPEARPLFLLQGFEQLSVLAAIAAVSYLRLLRLTQACVEFLLLPAGQADATAVLKRIRATEPSAVRRPVG